MKKQGLLLFTLVLLVPLTACSSSTPVKSLPPTPPQVSDTDTIVTMEQDTPIQNLSRFNTFISNEEKGVKDSIRIITLSPNGTTVPNDLSYDGKQFTLNITNKDPNDPTDDSVYTYSGTNIVKKEKGKYYEYDLKISTEQASYIPLIFVPKGTTSTKKS